MTTLTKEIPYEIERNKPMPNLAHGVIQTKISHLLMSFYEGDYLFPNEVSLATTPKSTPDICIYPKKKISMINISAKEKDPPITTIEIQSPSQSIEELNDTAWNLYFPMGVKSAWVVVPSLKTIQIFLPSKQKLMFSKGKLKDPVTNIEIDVEKVFEDLE